MTQKRRPNWPARESSPAILIHSYNQSD